MNKKDLQIIKLAKDMTNDQIAEELGLDTKSISARLTKLYKRFNITENKRNTLVRMMEE